MYPNSKQPKIKIPLESIDVGLNWLALFILLLMFGIAAYYFNQLPDTIPIHFNGKGEADGYGSKNTIWFLPILSVIMFLGLWKASKIPHLYNYPGKITEENAENKYRIASRMMRGLNVIIMVIFCYIVWTSIRVALGTQGGLGSFFLICILVGLSVFIFYFIIRLSKNK